ncbi:MAG: multicopper oxidase family protein [Pseudomonadota bacterium]
MLHNTLTRRSLLLASAFGAGTALGARHFRANAAEPLAIRTRETAFSFGGPETPGLVSTLDGAAPPVIRLKQGEPAIIDMTNGIDEYTTMHWHGIRLPNVMDGVPYLTQFPMIQGETFRYAFTPPDAGTFWYHPHCMTMRQMAHGMTGVLIVDEAEDLGFDADIALNLKDFRIDDEGALLPYFTARGAARGGTFGNVRTSNWIVNERHEVPAGGLVRLRIAATDTTRVYRLTLPNMEGKIIAWDGHPVREPIAWPEPGAQLRLGPGQRVDMAVRMPGTEGIELPVIGQFGQSLDPLATLVSVGSSLGRSLNDLGPLPENPVSLPDIANAEVREFVFGWTPDGDGQNNGFCGNSEFTFWSIDRKAWPGDAVSNVGPLAELKIGRSYVLRLRNESPNNHPIHLHGLAFIPIRSNQREIPKNWTDTVLLRKNEIIDVALVADNEGDWAFHCHVIEHQKTGLAGYIRVA